MDIREYLQSSAKSDLRFFPFEVANHLSDLAAVLLYDIYNRTAEKKKPTKRDGFSWTYDTHAVFAANHPYASEAGIRKAFLALEKDGLIRIEKTGKYNKKRYDEKWWYALTERGKACVAKWRMRFNPDVAISPDATKEGAMLGLPKAVILQYFRHKLHEGDGDGYVRMELSELRIPYSTKTIGRHLDGIVANRILERHPDDKHRYRVVDNWREDETPLTVPCAKLLPPLQVGDVGLITAPSGGGKTSYGTFSAAQHALMGLKVMHFTLEEPASNVVERIYAQEFGISYTGLHRGRPDVVKALNTKLQTASERMQTLGSNLRVVDLSGKYPTPENLLEKITELASEGFCPDMVLIDQLEFSSAGEDEPTEPPPDVLDQEQVGEPIPRAVPLALAITDAFRGQPYRTWVLHQVEGSPRPEFRLKDICGRESVTDCFDVVLGLGRTDYGQTRVELRVFSLTPASEHEANFEADFAHMRFKPKK